MAKVERMVRGSQNRLALQTLESLSEQHPGNPWIGITRAAVLMGESEPTAAAEILHPVVEQHPDHLHAIALLANATFSADGFELAKPFIHRAFQRCEVAYPEMIGNLALGIAAAMYARKCYMAARQHLTLAMRLVSNEHKQGVFVRLLEFDGNRQLPFPFRSVHELAKFSDDEDWIADATKARRLSDMGCWRPAAKIFTKLAEEHADRADLWRNAALCRAWDGDERHAAGAFHKAAELTENTEDAIELETLAQLLDDNTTDDVVKFTTREFQVDSIDELIPRLEAHPRAVRLEISEEEDENAAAAASFYLFDREEASEPPTESIALDEITNVIAQLELYHPDPNTPASSPTVFVSGEIGEPLDSAASILAECADDSLTEQSSDSDAFDESIPRELAHLAWRWHFPERTPPAVQRKLERRKWTQSTLEEWVAIPKANLGGVSPQEAAGKEELRVKLSAAVHVLDTRCDGAQFNLDIDALRQQLSLEPPATLDVPPDAALNTLTVMQLERLPIEQLTDAQLSTTLNRAVLVHHGRFMKRVLEEALKRPECAERIDSDRVHSTMFELCIEHGDIEGALEWSSRRIEEAKSDEKPFETALQWTLRELSLRLTTNPPLISFADDADVMRHALKAATRGFGSVEPNPQVGAVIVDEHRRLIAEGIHEQFGGPHAEINALAAAGPRAAGATMFVTLEPCCHHGKTGPCTAAIVAAGLRRVVVGSRDPNSAVDGQGIAQLRAAGIAVETGLLETEADRLIAPFRKRMTAGLPWMHAKWAMTLDGRIAAHSGHSQWISSPESRAITHTLRGQVDAIVVGANTAIVDDPMLTARPSGPRTATRIVVDSRARLPVDSQLVRTAGEIPTLLATSTAADSAQLKELEAHGVEILALPLPGDEGAPRVDLNGLLRTLGERTMTHVLVEGGGGLLGSLFDDNLVDEVHVFVAPKIVGGSNAVSPVAGTGRAQISELSDLDSPEIQTPGGDVYIHGRIRR
eukprot:g21903.t1